MSKINITGKIGNNYLTGSAHTIEVHSSYNGSGDDAFGGAEEWPTITATVGFQAGEERRALGFVKKLTELIHTEFGNKQGGGEL